MKRKKNLYGIFFLIVFGLTLPATSRAETTINLQVLTSTTTLYSQNISVSACALSPTSSTTLVTSAYCAMEQAGLQNSWSWFGEDVFLNSANGIVNNQDNNNVYWGWFGNLEYGQTALNKHNLAAGENLLLAYGINPLRISADNLTPTIGATSTILIEQFGLDASYNPVWTAAASSIVSINGQLFSADNSGHYEFLISSESPYAISASKTGFIDGDILTIAPTAKQPPAPPAASGGSWLPTPKKIDLAKAINFLASKQKDDGSFGGIYTDWVAIAFGAYNETSPATEKLKNFLLQDKNPGTALTDYERRAMGLMALGLNPYDSAPINYIEKITAGFDGEQFGDKNLYNDDIFAIFPLLSSGFSPSDHMIAAAAKFIVSKQGSDGSWSGVDLTSAAIQALVLLPSNYEISEAIKKAKEYLHKQQKYDGSFGNSFSTSWVIQAYNAVGDLPQFWLKDKYPQDFLASLQADDGGLENPETEANTRIWATAYAIPAFLDKTWDNILQKFTPPLPLVSPDNNNSGSVSTTATTTLAADQNLASSTPAVMASTSPTIITGPGETETRVPAAMTTNEIRPEEENLAAAAKKITEPKSLETKPKIRQPENESSLAAVSAAPEQAQIAPTESLINKAVSVAKEFTRKLYRNILFIFSNLY